MTSTAIITLLDDSFLPGAKVFLHSLLKHNPGFDLPFIILDAGVSPNTLDTLKEIYPKIELRQIEKDNYTRINKQGTPERLLKTYYTFDVFIQPETRLIFFDMDTLILGSIQELLRETASFAAVKCYQRSTDQLVNQINSGVFVINTDKLPPDIYEKLITSAGSRSPDQDAINKVFAGKIKYLPKRYNVEKRLLHSVKLREYRDIRNITVLHFVGVKPWQPKEAKSLESKYGEYETLWHKLNQ